MRACKSLAFSLLFVFALVGGDSVKAADAPSGATIVTIHGEMCGGCVKKMQGTLAKVPGIVGVEGNAAEKTMTIVPAPQTKVSPKAIWEAIEQAGKKPVKLVGPEGEFVSKPSH